MKRIFRNEIGKLVLTATIEDTKQGKVLSIQGDHYLKYDKTPDSCGQCIDELKAFSDIKDVDKFIDVWEEYHLNDLHAGTPEQEDALDKEFGKNYPDYAIQCAYLKEIGLYEVELNGKPYKYGHAWLFEEVPQDVLDFVVDFMSRS